MIEPDVGRAAGATLEEQSVGLRKLLHDFAFHFFGAEGLENLRSRHWAFITVVGPTWGFIADLCTVFGPAVRLFFLIFISLFLALQRPSDSERAIASAVLFPVLYLSFSRRH